jgi:ribosomal protein S18 acetylase RimI-like enzyme
VTLHRSRTTDVIRRGQEKVRTSRWQGDDDVAFIMPSPETPFLSSEFVRYCLSQLSGRGYRKVVTGALSPLEQAGFLAAGFDVEQHLRLLSIDVAPGLPGTPPGLRLRRVPGRRVDEVLDVDRAAFGPFWRLDRAGLDDALRATPAVRHRMAMAPKGRVAGYAICGRSGQRGFVQRLAVHPEGQRHGTGRRLLLDGLRWMRKHGVERAVVNTQAGNTGALSLYLNVGFREEPVGLSVLSTGLV